MSSYTPRNIPPMDKVTARLLGGEIPLPSNFQGEGGHDPTLLPAFYFAYAIMRDCAKNESLADRNGVPLILHSYNAAYKSAFRENYKVLPSGYSLTPEQMRLALLGNVEEVFAVSVAQHVAGAFVMKHVLHELFGQSVSDGVDALTNKLQFALASREDYLKNFCDPENGVSTKEIVSSFEDAKNRLRIDIPQIYHFVYSQLYGQANYLSNIIKTDLADWHSLDENSPEIERIAELTQQHISALNRILENYDCLCEEEVGKQVVGLYDRIIETAGKQRKHDEMEQEPLMRSRYPNLDNVRVSLYRDYLNDLTGFARRRYRENPVGGFIDALMAKTTEMTDTSVTLVNAPLETITRVDLEAMMYIEKGIEFANWLMEKGEGYQATALTYRRALEYLFEVHNAVLTARRDFSAKVAGPIDNVFGHDLILFNTLLEKNRNETANLFRDTS